MQGGFSCRVAVAVLATCALLPPGARAQTSDVVFGGWSWRTRDQGSRPAGLGGAYVAVADSVRTVSVNPAGLSLIPKAELTAGFGDLWAGVGYSLGTANAPANVPPAARPTQPAQPVPCSPSRPTRPFALAIFGEQAVTQDNQVNVVRAPGISESGQLSASSEQIGLGLSKGLTPWLNLGATFAWGHLTMQGQSLLLDLQGDELGRVTLSGDANKARVLGGMLLTFGPSRDPTAVRLGVAYQQDLFPWSVERTVTDRVHGVVTSGPKTVDIVEPPVLAGGLAWRVSDALLITGELDYVWYDRVHQALSSNTDAATAAPFTVRRGLEPRLGVELTEPSPTGGYFKLRAGVRRETSGVLEYGGADAALKQAFIPGPAAFRAAIGASLLGEFYENAFRLDVDISQVVVERLSAVNAAAQRRFSLALTLRM
jgi:hypothetical protein